MLQRPEGIVEVVEAPGWQPPTVRGALAGTRKRLGLTNGSDLVSQRSGWPPIEPSHVQITSAPYLRRAAVDGDPDLLLVQEQHVDVIPGAGIADRHDVGEGVS